MSVSVQIDGKLSRIYDENYNTIANKAMIANSMLLEHNSYVNNMTGWLNPTINHSDIDRIKLIAERIKNQCDVFIVIGAGGSYLGAKAIIEALNSEYYNQLNTNTPKIFFIGNSLSAKNISDVLEICDTGDVCVNVISKSGTTLEPSIAFRILKNYLEKRYGKDDAHSRIYCTTDADKGSLRKIAQYNGYCSLTVPKNMGGRYSVLSSVGLLPIAVANIDIEQLVNGAVDAKVDFEDNDAMNVCSQYAALRYLLNKNGKNVELIASFEPCMEYFLQWHKQLFGESLGKNKQGIFPVPVTYTRDLHSIGQYVQDGTPILFETIITFDDCEEEIDIPYEYDDIDGLNYLCNGYFSGITECSVSGVIDAHVSGGTPVIRLTLPKRDAYNLGYLIYFFEKSCALNGYMDGINPFNQPGVEAYKANVIRNLVLQKEVEKVINI